MLNWNKLIRTPWKTFEDFCYTLSVNEFENQGQFTSIDDSGGGDGVEFYLQFPNGNEWGWQAKFFFPNIRLNVSNRKKQMKDSLKRALEIHPNLKRLYICTPGEFTAEENRWFQEDFLLEVTESREVDLMHWGERDFHRLLTKPKNIGIKNYFFGDLEFNIGFFKNNFEEIKQIVGNNYIPNLHLIPYFEECILENLNHNQIRKIIVSCEKLIEIINKLELSKKEPEIFKKYFPDKNWNEFSLEFNRNKADIIDRLKIIYHKFQTIISVLKKGNFVLDFNDLQSFLKENFKIETEDLEKILKMLKQEDPLKLIAEILTAYLKLNDSLSCLLSSSIEIKAYAGMGKTQASCHIIETFLNNNKPAIILLGKQFRTLKPLKTQILELLGLQNLIWEDFLDTLEITSRIFKTRIPLIIDGLNESIVNGKFSTIWKDDLLGIISAIRNRKGILLVIFYRPEYEKYIFKDQNNIIDKSFNLNGLDQKGIEKYLDYYHLDLKIPYRLMKILRNPLFLRIFCETYGNPVNEVVLDQKVFSELYVIEIFRKFLNKENKEFNESLDLSPNSEKLIESLQLIAKEIWLNKSRTISLCKFFSLIERRTIIENWENSVSKKLLDKGLIFNRTIFEEEEEIFFTFDNFAGFIIANWLIENYQNDLKKSEISDDVIKCLINHPLSEDITYFLSVLLITNYKTYLNKISKNQFNQFFDLYALCSVPKEFLTESMINYVNSIFNKIIMDNFLINFLFYNIFTPDHPLNINFFTINISKLSLSERDLYWTEYIRNNYNDLNSFINDFKESFDASKFSIYEKKEMLLKIRFIIWLLPTTIRNFRNELTDLLFKFGCIYPVDFFNIIKDMIIVKDPYIIERLISALYGVAMNFHNQLNSNNYKNHFITWAKELFFWFFKEDTTYSTTHFFIRQHSRYIIEIALLYEPALFNQQEIQLLRPPYKSGGIRDWKEISLEDIGPFQSGAYPFRLENFGNYILGNLVPDFMNYQYENEDFQKVLKNLYWRMNNLGFTGAKFADIDKTINDLNYFIYSKSNIGKVDRYGKKYSWIAYYELAGFRSDLGLIEEWYKSRLLEYFYDPSFPFPPYSLDLGDVNLLKKKEESIEERIQILEKFANENLLIRNDLSNEKEDWIILNAILYQSQKKGWNQIVYRIDGVIYKFQEEVKSPELIFDDIKNLDTRFDPQSLNFIYAGEIPWCDLFINIENDNKIINLTYLYHLSEVEFGFDNETYVPSNIVCSHLGLKKKGRFFEFFDANGKLGFITFEMRKIDNLNGLLIYIRKDLLKDLMTKINGTFIQRIKIVVNYLLDNSYKDEEFIPDEYKTYKERINILFPFESKKFTLNES